MDEINDIVDAHDRVIATKPRAEVAGDFVNTRYVNVFILNEQGQFWVPWRRADLERWPGSPDFAVGGAVLAGEGYSEAVAREISEEVGLTMTADQLREIAYLSPYKYPIACFTKVYELVVDEAPQFLPAEHSSAQWLDLSELLRLLSANQQPIKTDLLPIVRLCYGHLSDIDRTVFQP